MARTSDKRERLVDAAQSLFHKQGFGPTSLADISQESGVPLGNVYYYFKTKDDIAAAVIDELADNLKKIGDYAEQQEDPRDVIMTMLDSLRSNCGAIAERGCPMGSLSIEFGKCDSPLTKRANDLLLGHVSWTNKQLQAMGRPDAQELAIRMVSNLQGAGMIAHAMHDPGVLDKEIDRIIEWVRKL
ncbi:MAG: TetR/AcrR family transcriptional regulator [Pseudomonadales bacterium]